MLGSAMLRVIALTLVVTLCRGQGQDATTTAGSFGADVVNAVVDRIRDNCIFSEDRLFLRRTAYVMSRDGYDSVTYRPGFNGGIWQITESMFLATKNCPSSISAACNNIRSKLKIDWPSTVTWSDLRKPLYSGIAAALYTLLTQGSTPMAGDIRTQADLWAQMYKQENTTFVTKAANTPVFKCTGKLDLAFILDSSGSVSVSDFDLMKNFTASVVDAMNVSQEAVRIADIVYGTSVSVSFDFNDYGSKEAAKAKLLATVKLGGGTNTAAALDRAKDTLYDYAHSNGARRDVRKVAVLVTDGRSNSYTATVTSAQRLKDAATTVFAVGVGNFLERELKAVASEPICSHVLTLTSFDKIDSIVTEIQKSTCEANYKLTKDVTTIKGELTEGTTETVVETPVPDTSKNKTIAVQVSCGILAVYVSQTNPKPGPSVFDHFYPARPGVPAILQAVETLPEGTRLYVTVLGSRLPQSVAALRNCSDYNWTMSVTDKTATPTVTVKCEENNVERTCTTDDVINAGICHERPESNYPIENPCTRENLEKGILRFRHPYDPTRFLQCDMQGRYYVTQCPRGVHFIPQSRACSFTPSPLGQAVEKSNPGGSSGGTTPTPKVTIASLCTPQALAKRLYYHAFAGNPKKYVQCDAWGNAYLRDCAQGTLWSQSAYTCIQAPKAARSLSVNTNTNTSTTTPAPSPVTTPPATAPTTAPCVHDELYEYRCDPSKFYMCNGGHLVLMSCPAGLHFNATVKVCDWPSSSAASLPLPASCQP